MSADRTACGRIGDWLWHGGRMRILKAITTNGGKVFEIGEIIRLERIEHYGEKIKLARTYWVSETYPDKGFCMTGWHEDDDSRFELVI